MRTAAPLRPEAATPGADEAVLRRLEWTVLRRLDGLLQGDWRTLMRGAIQGERNTMATAAQAIGYFGGQIDPHQRSAVIGLFELACEPLREAGAYDFGSSDLPRRVREAGMQLSTDKDLWHTPPADALFLHRKIGGLYLLAARLKARVSLQALAQPYL